MAKVFFSYSHKDEELRNRLQTALVMLQRQGKIETWHDRRITAGTEFEGEISTHLEEADVILLLVSPDFLASSYCYDIEMGRALERHHAGEARVIPVILRRCDWHQAPFSKLMATPPDGKPIRSYPDLDDAFQDVTDAIRRAVDMLGSEADAPASPRMLETAAERPPRTTGPRSSNLALPKRFSDVDRDRFLEECYVYVRSFFENSLEELKQRNPGIDTSFRKISEDNFSATIYRDGRELGRCWVRLGSAFGKGIAYSTSDSGNSMNEHLRVENDEYGLFLRSMGMSHNLGQQHDQKLTQEGGAEMLWGLLLNPLLHGR